MERNKRQIGNYTVALILFSYFLGCSKSSKEIIETSEVNSIYAQVLPQAFDSLTQYFNLKDKIIMYDGGRTDKLKTTILKITSDSLANDSSIQAELIRSLNKRIQEEVILDLNVLSRGRYHIFDEEELIEDDSDSICILSLSPIAFDEKIVVGCFYLGLNCEANKGKGYFIYIYKEENWKILAILQTWHAGRT